MRTIEFSDGYQFEVQYPSEQDFTSYKYRFRELFAKLLTPEEAKFYRRQIANRGINMNNLIYWSKIKADAATSIPGDALEQLSDALGIPMRDLKYRD
jgi:hypothetical protein